MEKLLITRKEAAAALSISVDKLDELREHGELPVCYIGSRVFFRAADLERFVARRFEEE